MYCELLDAQDAQYSHKYYQRAYRGAVSILLFLIDNPSSVPAPTTDISVISASDSTTGNDSKKPSSGGDPVGALPAAPSSS